MANQIAIDLKEAFPKLSKAPIVEAIIEVRTTVQIGWDEAYVAAQLKERIPDYPHTQSLNVARHEFKVDMTEGHAAPEQTVLHMGWRGLRCESEDRTQIVQFFKDSFTFSRLYPYDCWEQFLTEALRLLDIYVSIAMPLQVDRLGLRYVNRLIVPQGPINLGDYYSNPPSSSTDFDLPLASFFHQDNFDVPNYPFGVNMIKTIQIKEDTGLILDIDVYSTEALELNQGLLHKQLCEMRWIKNKMFYNNIASRALEDMK